MPFSSLSTSPSSFGVSNASTTSIFGWQSQNARSGFMKSSIFRTTRPSNMPMDSVSHPASSSSLYFRFPLLLSLHNWLHRPCRWKVCSSTLHASNHNHHWTVPHLHLIFFRFSCIASLPSHFLNDFASIYSTNELIFYGCGQIRCGLIAPSLLTTTTKTSSFYKVIIQLY